MPLRAIPWLKRSGFLEQDGMRENVATKEEIHGAKSVAAAKTSKPESSSATEGIGSSPSNAAGIEIAANNMQPPVEPKPVPTSDSASAGTGIHSSHIANPSKADDDLLPTLEYTPRTYTCHKESIGKPPKPTGTRLTSKFGRMRSRRMTPPKPRGHDNIAATEIKGDLFKILANECMEQLYDDNFEGKFGAVHVLAFSRLHHMNLHYFEAELAAELANIVEKTSTDRKQMLRIRKTLRGYSEAIVDYERVLKHWEAPVKGQLTAFHNSILPENFRKLVEAEQSGTEAKLGGIKAKQGDLEANVEAEQCSINGETKDRKKYCTWDNGYMSLDSGNEWATNFFTRIAATLIGGLALIVPMLIMSVHKASTKNLVTTCVAVSLVAFVLATFSLGSPNDILGLTAAYAAVLVVYIGTSTL